jgi:hypothetical protein
LLRASFIAAQPVSSEPMPAQAAPTPARVASIGHRPYTISREPTLSLTPPVTDAIASRVIAAVFAQVQATVPDRCSLAVASFIDTNAVSVLLKLVVA